MNIDDIREIGRGIGLTERKVMADDVELTCLDLNGKFSKKAICSAWLSLKGDV